MGSNLNKYMKKKGMPEDPGENKTPEAAPMWMAEDPEGHGDISTNDFTTSDTDKDPLDEGDETEVDEPESKKAMSNLDKYQKMKSKK